MAQGATNRVSLYRLEESAWAETPGGSDNMSEVPFTSESLTPGKESVTSNTIRTDRMRSDVAKVGESASGDIAFELSFLDYDAFLEGCLGAAFNTQSKTGDGASDLDFAAAGSGVQVITGPAASFPNFVVGAWVRVKDAVQAANNGIFKVTAKNDTTITIANAIGEAEVDVAATVSQKMLRNGVVEKSYLIETRFNDISEFVHYLGMRVNQLQLSVESQAIVTGSFGFTGKNASLSLSSGVNSGGSDIAASANPVMNASANVGSITEGGAALTTAIKSVNFTLNNNHRSLFAIGSDSAKGVNDGVMDLTGTMEAYFEDATLYDKLINHTSTSLSFRVTDTTGNVIVITLPKLFFTDGAPSVGGLSDDVLLPLGFTAVRDPTTDTQIQIDALAV